LRYSGIPATGQLQHYKNDSYKSQAW